MLHLFRTIQAPLGRQGRSKCLRHMSIPKLLALPHKVQQGIFRRIFFDSKASDANCWQAFMHMRMRKRVDDLLTVLNRAKLPAEAAVEKKAWGGRSYTK
jgi:hypothetical protein